VVFCGCVLLLCGGACVCMFALGEGMVFLVRGGGCNIFVEYDLI